MRAAVADGEERGFGLREGVGVGGQGLSVARMLQGGCGLGEGGDGFGEGGIVGLHVRVW